VIPDFEVLPWMGVFGPPNLPRNIVEQMSGALDKIVSNETFVRSLEKIGPEPYYLPSEPFAAFVRADVPVWTEHAQIAGIEPRSGRARDLQNGGLQRARNVMLPRAIERGWTNQGRMDSEAKRRQNSHDASAACLKPGMAATLYARETGGAHDRGPRAWIMTVSMLSAAARDRYRHRQ
jgi:hypothetical protein